MVCARHRSGHASTAPAGARRSRILPQVGATKIRVRAPITHRATPIAAGDSAAPMPFDDEAHDLSVEVGGKHAARGRLEPLLRTGHDQFADAFRIERVVCGAK